MVPVEKVEGYRSEFHLVSPSGKARLGTWLGELLLAKERRGGNIIQ